MTLWEMLDRTLYYGRVLIYSRNAYDQCVPIFRGKVQDAREEGNQVWDYLPYEVDQWICGKGATLIYVKHYDYENRLEKCYSNSDKWTEAKRPYRRSYEVERELDKWKLTD